MKKFKQFLMEEHKEVFKAVIITTDADGKQHETPVESSDSIREKVHSTVKDMTGKGHKLVKVDYKY